MVASNLINFENLTRVSKLRTSKIQGRDFEIVKFNGRQGLAQPSGDGSDSGDELFKPRGEPTGHTPGEAADPNPEAIDALDSARAPADAETLNAWDDAAAVQALKTARFVTGDWAEGAARDAAQPRDGGSDGEGNGVDDDEDGGDFEDMETGRSTQLHHLN